MSAESPRPTLLHLIEYVGFAGLRRLCERLSIERGTGLVASLARTIGPRSPLRKRALLNLGLALPELSDAERQAIAAGMFDHLARSAIEYIHLEQLGADESRITISGEEHVHAAREAGKGAVFVSGHLGNWEAIRLATQRLGWPSAIIYRAFNNPLVDADSRRMMQVIDAPIFHKGKRGTLGLLRHIRKGGGVMILADQRFSGAPEIPFFGIPAKTSLAAAELAQQYGAQLIPVTGIRRGRSSRFDVTFSPPLDLEAGPMAVMERVNVLLENHIRETPEQYFWLHNRWGKKAFDTLQKS